MNISCSPPPPRSHHNTRLPSGDQSGPISIPSLRASRRAPLPSASMTKMSRSPSSAFSVERKRIDDPSRDQTGMEPRRPSANSTSSSLSTSSRSTPAVTPSERTDASRAIVSPSGDQSMTGEYISLPATPATALRLLPSASIRSTSPLSLKRPCSPGQLTKARRWPSGDQRGHCLMTPSSVSFVGSPLSTSRTNMSQAPASSPT